MIWHFVGCNPASVDLTKTLQRIFLEFSERFKIEKEIAKDEQALIQVI
jgi:hypothetical protein